jgi:hypothetical protein
MSLGRPWPRKLRLLEEPELGKGQQSHQQLRKVVMLWPHGRHDFGSGHVRGILCHEQWHDGLSQADKPSW